jgi:hypothetical protein
VYHVRCISKWHDAATRRNARRDARDGARDGDAPCPTCKRAFAYDDCVTIYLDHRPTTGEDGGTPRRRASADADADGGDGRVAARARELRRARERAREAEDAMETLRREKEAIEGRVKASDDARREVEAARREVRAMRLARDALATKARRDDEEKETLRAKHAALTRTLREFEDKERVEREVAASASSLGEREMLKRLEGSDPRLAMTTLVRNLCAKNKQIASQREQYDALARKVREKEKYIKALEAKVDAFRDAETTRASAKPKPATREPATDAFPLGGRANSRHAWGVDDPSEFAHPPTRRRAEKKRDGKTSLRQGDDGLMKRLAPPPTRDVRRDEINLVSDDDDVDGVEDDVLANILNDVDERVARKRANAATSGLAPAKRRAGSFLKSSPRAPSVSNGTFIKHGPDGRGGRGKFFAT